MLEICEYIPNRLRARGNLDLVGTNHRRVLVDFQGDSNLHPLRRCVGSRRNSEWVSPNSFRAPIRGLLFQKRVNVRWEMRSAAIRVLLLVILALGGVASSAAMAGAQVLDPIGTVTSAISTITSQTTVVSDLTDSVTSATSGGSGATDAVSGTTDAVWGATDAVFGAGILSGSGTTSATSSGADGGSGSASSGDASSGSTTDSNRGSPRTRFDRLPRRYESLLERIESGRHVRANIARLRALLASASPQLRARVLRLIRLEIRRLERGGLTRRERAAMQRLRTLLTTLQGDASRPAPQAPLSLWRVEGSGILWATLSDAGVSAATAGSESGSRVRPGSGRDEAGSATPRLPLPLVPPSWDPPYLLLLLLWIAIACLVLLLTGPRRHLLSSPVRGMVEVRRLEVLALAAAIGLSLVMALVTVLVVQTVLL
jgi:hypothetical protein